MKRAISPLVMVLAVLLALSLACSIPGSVSTTPTPGGPPSTSAMASLVAKQLTALASPPVNTNTPAPTETSTLLAMPPEDTPAPPVDGALRICYTDAGHNLWVWTSSGRPQQLTTSGDVDEARISDDGHLIAFVRRSGDTAFSLWSIHSDGTRPVQLVSTAELNALATSPDAIGVTPYSFEWIPGGNVLAYNTQPLFNGPGLMLNNDLWLVDGTGGAPRNLLPAGHGGMFYYSPDGSKIAIAKPDRISLINADGTNRRESVVAFPNVITYSEYQYYPRPVWSPHSDYLRVAIPPADPLATPRQPTSLWNIPADGARAARIGSVTVNFLDTVIFSPDLGRIAYLATPTGESDPNLRDLHIAKADGSADAIYASGNLGLVNWALDSNHFVFSMGDFENVQLGQVGGVYAPLTDVGSGTSIKWIDPMRFVFLHRASGAWDLRVGSTVGGTGSLEVDTIFGDPGTFRPNFDFSGH